MLTQTRAPHLNCTSVLYNVCRMQPGGYDTVQLTGCYPLGSETGKYTVNKCYLYTVDFKALSGGRKVQEYLTTDRTVYKKWM